MIGLGAEINSGKGVNKAYQSQQDLLRLEVNQLKAAYKTTYMYIFEVKTYPHT